MFWLSQIYINSSICKRLSSKTVLNHSKSVTHGLCNIIDYLQQQNHAFIRSSLSSPLHQPKAVIRILYNCALAQLLSWFHSNLSIDSCKISRTPSSIIIPSQRTSIFQSIHTPNSLLQICREMATSCANSKSLCLVPEGTTAAILVLTVQLVIWKVLNLIPIRSFPPVLWNEAICHESQDTLLRISHTSSESLSPGASDRITSYKLVFTMNTGLCIELKSGYCMLGFTRTKNCAYS